MTVLTTPKGKLIAHGVPPSYSNHKCRCDLCREAWNAYCARLKREKVGKVMPEGMTHGNEAGYQKGCRCTLCKNGHRDYRVDRDFRLKSGEATRMREEQGGICACCLKPTDKLVVDHLHGTHHIRGLLCNSCNTGIGKLGDNIEGLERALDYLKRTAPK